MKVLIADDNASDRLLLSKIVEKQGHQILQAENGKQAIECYLEGSPDVILMDVLMPVLDGKAAAKEIKRLAGEDLIPIIFLTALDDAQSLADCLAAGGDDFLTKPYNYIILKAKVDALMRMKVMHETLQKQRDAISVHNERMFQEQVVAKTVFDNIAHSGCLDAVNIKHMLSPLAVFNGDVLLAARKPSGGMHVLLGDFTGHGLPAAIGAMPMAEIFYGMTARGYDLCTILREINLKLKTILPVGFFCCAAVVDLNFFKRSMSIWMGGVPDAYLLNHSTQAIKSIKSCHLPLGVVGNAQFNDEFTEYCMGIGDRLFLWSDGILESRNEHGEMYGEERLLANFTKGITQDSLFDAIKKSVNEFVGDSGHDDDTTMIELKMVAESELQCTAPAVKKSVSCRPSDWSMKYELGTSSLKNFNPLPSLMNTMMEVPALRSMSGQLFTVISELYTNALEHGVLQLDSSIKTSHEGFVEYYKQKALRLEALTVGHITVKMTQSSVDGDAGILTLEVEDSGAGFDFSELSSSLDAPGSAKLSGRGIPLINTLCHSLEYYGCGNRVIAEIHWH